MAHGEARRGDDEKAQNRDGQDRYAPLAIREQSGARMTTANRGTRARSGRMPPGKPQPGLSPGARQPVVRREGRGAAADADATD